MRTGDVTKEFRTNRMVTDSVPTSNGRLCPFCPVESFEHAQNFPPDGTDINGHQRTRNGFIGLETDIKRIRPDTNGCYEMDKTSISMFEILKPGGSAWGKYSI